MSHILERVFSGRRNTISYMRQFFLRDYIKNAIRVFFLGIIVGILIIFLCKNKLQTDISLLNEEWMLSMQTNQVNSKELFVYILIERFKSLGISVLLSTTMVGCFYLYGYIAFWGIGIGIFLAIACLRYGMGGINIFFFATFPQMLIYLPVWIFIFHLCYMLCIRLYYPQKDYWRSNQSTKVFVLKTILQIGIAFILMFAGILLESYMNPKIFFSYIKKF